MKKCNRRFFLVFATVASCFFASGCFARTLMAQSVIYLDANNNIIGQQMIACNNLAQHAGNIDHTNPYHVYQEWPCGVQCHYYGASGWVDPNDPSSFPVPGKDIECDNGAYYVMYKNVATINTANGMSAEQFCSQPSPVFGSIPCDNKEPTYAGNLVGFQSGWGG